VTQFFTDGKRLADDYSLNLIGGAGISITPVANNDRADVTVALNVGLVSVKDFGAKGDGVTDDTAAFVRAMAGASGRGIFLPKGTYLVNNLTISQGGTRFVALAGYNGVQIQKNADGPMFIVTATEVEFHNVVIDGVGATYTGVGFDVQSSEFRYIGGKIWHTASYCVDFTVNDATKNAILANCSMQRVDSPNPVIRLAPADTIPTDKLILGVHGFGDLIDTNGCETCLIIGCDFQNMTFNANSKKVCLIGNRMATLGANTTVLGVNHAIIGNIHAGHFILPANNCSANVVGPNVCVTASVDQTAPSALNVLIDAYGQSRLSVNKTVQSGNVAQAYSASITPDASAGNWQTITVTNGTAFTINAPTNPPDASHTQELTVEILNSSGGAMGAITWNAAFVLVGGVFTNPANTKKRHIRFEWNGASWVETGRATADY
jgi:hypothetical protein